MKKIFLLVLIGSIGCFCSCRKQLEAINDNPNGADPTTTNPNLVLPTVLTATGELYVTEGFGDIAGVMQHTQADGHTGAHNEYDWSGSSDWTAYYAILLNNKYVYDRSVTLRYPLQQGITLVIKSMVFGLITDLWGDAPYSHALDGEENGEANTFPVYDKQQDIYTGILADLDSANTLLSQPASQYNSTVTGVDVFYGGDPTKWRKLANSLALRFYLRISDKLPDVAKAGIEKIVNDPNDYPIITSAADDATMGFAGSSSANSWPSNVNYDSDSSNYRTLKMCASLVNAMNPYNDPRLGVWANKVQVFLLVSDNFPTGTDRTVDTTVGGQARQVRYLSPDVLAAKGLTLADINEDPNYVGLPPALVGPAVYNLSQDPSQGSHNFYVSWLNSMYMNASGPLLLARMLSAAEVNFILAECAQKGWSVGKSAQTYYNAAIQASLTAWGVGAAYGSFITQPGIAYDGTLQQLITQKWIASWTAATEAWFDFRRTGYPALVTGPAAKGPVLPVRLYYELSERDLNQTNCFAAEADLQTTTYSGYGADATNGYANSAWSKPWVAQGTGKPW